MNWKHYIATQNWGYNSLALVAIVMPLSRKLVPPAIVAAIVVALWMRLRKGRPARVIHSGNNVPILVMAALYVALLVGTFFTTEPMRACRELEYKLSFLVFPLLFVVLPGLSRERFRALLDLFTTSCLLFLGFAVIRGVVFGVSEHTLDYLSYAGLGYVFHPTYMATYQAVALFHLMMKGGEGSYLFGRKWIHLLSEVLIVLFIVMLASKAGLIAALLVLLAYPIFSGGQYALRYRAWLRAGLLAAIMASLSLTVPSTLKRLRPHVNDVVIVMDDVPSATIPSRSSSALRLAAWKASWELLKDNPWGLGTGNVQPALNAVYRRNGEDYAADRNLNAHNQYFQTALELGWAGLILLFVLLGSFFRVTLREKNHRALVIGALISFHCLFESFLEVQAGVVFTCFWITAVMLTGQHRSSSGTGSAHDD